MVQIAPKYIFLEYLYVLLIQTKKYHAHPLTFNCKVASTVTIVVPSPSVMGRLASLNDKYGDPLGCYREPSRMTQGKGDVMGYYGERKWGAHYKTNKGHINPSGVFIIFYGVHKAIAIGSKHIKAQTHGLTLRQFNNVKREA